MILTLGVVVTTALIVFSSFALADVLDNGALSVPVARAWLVAITLVPGIGATLWLRHRRRIRKTEAIGLAAGAVQYPSAADLMLLHEEIDRFRSRQA